MVHRAYPRYIRQRVYDVIHGIERGQMTSSNEWQLEFYIFHTFLRTSLSNLPRQVIMTFLLQPKATYVNYQTKEEWWGAYKTIHAMRPEFHPDDWELIMNRLFMERRRLRLRQLIMKYRQSKKHVITEPEKEPEVIDLCSSDTELSDKNYSTDPSSSDDEPSQESSYQPSPPSKKQKRLNYQRKWRQPKNMLNWKPIESRHDEDYVPESSHSSCSEELEVDSQESVDLLTVDSKKPLDQLVSKQTLYRKRLHKVPFKPLSSWHYVAPANK